jgi:hypothetical protein
MRMCIPRLPGQNDNAESTGQVRVDEYLRLTQELVVTRAQQCTLIFVLPPEHLGLHNSSLRLHRMVMRMCIPRLPGQNDNEEVVGAMGPGRMLEVS